MNPTAIFTLLTLVVSYLYAAGFYLAGMRWQAPAAQAVGVGYMFIPAAVVFVVQRLLVREDIVRALEIRWRPNRWWMVAWILPAALSLATLGISLLLPGVAYSPEMAGLWARFQSVFPAEALEQMKKQTALLPVHPFWLALVQGLIAGATINAVAAFGEELGWRGFLLRELSHLGFWRASLYTGLIWGVWHAPLILQGHNYPQHPQAGVLMMVAWCVLLSPLFAYVRLKAGSLLAAALIHGSLNGTAGLALMVVSGGSDLTVGLTGLAGFIVLAGLNLLLFAHDRFFSAAPLDRLLAAKGRGGLSHKIAHLPWRAGSWQ